MIDILLNKNVKIRKDQQCWGCQRKFKKRNFINTYKNCG